MTPYKHTLQYYETDKMGITHHSNYIRWMEEARIGFLNPQGRIIRMNRAYPEFSALLSSLIKVKE